MEFDANLITVEEVHALTDEELSDAIDAKYGEDFEQTDLKCDDPLVMELFDRITRGA